MAVLSSFPLNKSRIFQIERKINLSSVFGTFSLKSQKAPGVEVNAESGWRQDDGRARVNYYYYFFKCQHTLQLLSTYTHLTGLWMSSWVVLRLQSKATLPDGNSAFFLNSAWFPRLTFSFSFFLFKQIPVWMAVCKATLVVGESRAM